MHNRRFGAPVARLSLIAALSGSLVLAGSPVAVFADPATDLAEATSQLEEIGREYQALQQDLLEATATVEETKGKIDETQLQLQEAQSILASNISSDYKTGGGKLIQVLLGATDFNDLISRVFYLDKVTDAQADAIESVRTLKSELESQQAEQEKNLADTQAKVQQQATNQQAAQQLVNSLSEEVRAQVEAEAETNEAVASGIQSAQNASTSSTSQTITGNVSNPVENPLPEDNTTSQPSAPSTGNNDSSSNNNSSSNNSGNNANSGSNTPAEDTNTSSGGGSSSSGGTSTVSSPIAYALAMEGQPYVYGGESLAEGGFDCSGLVYYAYRCIGITLPRSSSAQMSYVKNNGRWTTSVSELQYGDLVFFPGHVAFYVGNGTVFGARTFGTPAGYNSIYDFGSFLGGGQI